MRLEQMLFRKHLTGSENEPVDGRKGMVVPAPSPGLDPRLITTQLRERQFKHR